MLYKAKDLKNYKLHCSDGEMGKVKDFYFDDKHWTVRYLIAETGVWLHDSQVLISPYALKNVDSETKCIHVNLTKKQIENSPSLSSDKPVSKQFEESYYGYYNWPPYWGGPYMWGNYPNLVRELERPRGMIQREKAWDPHLRSTHDVSGRHIEAIDGGIGHVDDFLLDDETWAIRYIIAATANWWPGKKILLAPQWIERVSWNESKVFVKLSRDTIKEAPEYTGEMLPTRDYETRLYRHFSRHGYWEGIDMAKVDSPQKDAKTRENLMNKPSREHTHSHS